MERPILLIEDDPTFAQELSAALADKGHRVVTAFSGREGLELFYRELPDLVVLDLILPEGDGFWVLEKIKERSVRSALPRVIVVTNLDTPEAVDHALRVGAFVYLPKAHHDIPDIVSRVEQALACDDQELW